MTENKEYLRGISRGETKKNIPSVLPHFKGNEWKLFYGEKSFHHLVRENSNILFISEYQRFHIHYLFQIQGRRDSREFKETSDAKLYPIIKK